MSRIFDALRKAQAGRSEPATPPPLAPPPRPAMGGHPGGPAHAERAVEPRAGTPLALSVTLDDEVVQQMTTLRIGLESALPERGCRVVIFQGPQGGEGTTTVAHQFAGTLARDRTLHILLVDANASRPTIELDPAHRIARCPVLASGMSPGPDVGVVINLHALPVTAERRLTGVYSPAEARELVEHSSGSYDWVVIDGPPVLDSSDAAPLAAVADVAVLVAQAGRTKRPVLARSAELLRKAGARVVGTVLNRRQLEIPEFIYRRL